MRRARNRDEAEEHAALASKQCIVGDMRQVKIINTVFVSDF